MNLTRKGFLEGLVGLAAASQAKPTANTAVADDVIIPDLSPVSIEAVVIGSDSLPQYPVTISLISVDGSVAAQKSIMCELRNSELHPIEPITFEPLGHDVFVDRWAVDLSQTPFADLGVWKRPREIWHGVVNLNYGKIVMQFKDNMLFRL